MASRLKNLSSYDPSQLPSSRGLKFCILVSEWNSKITTKLLSGAMETLISQGTSAEDIRVEHVPGSFELSLASAWAARTDCDAVICLGCVIRGETSHFEFICQAVAHGITRSGLESKKPVIFGVLTTENEQQAVDRSGGKHGNKGVEAAIAAIKMVSLHRSLK